MISDHGHENSQFDVFDHPDVQFIMIMRRYPLFYNAFLITPCLLISFLTALVYYLPCASHQKITFCTSVLLGKFSLNPNRVNELRHGLTSAQELRHQILTSTQVINFGTLLFHGAEVNISIELGAEVHSLVAKLLLCRSYACRASIASYVE